MYFWCLIKCLYLSNLPISQSRIAPAKWNNHFSGNSLATNFLALRQPFQLQWWPMHIFGLASMLFFWLLYFLLGLFSVLLCHHHLWWWNLVVGSLLQWLMQQSTLTLYLWPLPRHFPSFAVLAPLSTWWIIVPLWNCAFSHCIFCCCFCCFQHANRMSCALLVSPTFASISCFNVIVKCCATTTIVSAFVISGIMICLCLKNTGWYSDHLHFFHPCFEIPVSLVWFCYVKSIYGMFVPCFLISGLLCISMEHPMGASGILFKLCCVVHACMNMLKFWMQCLCVLSYWASFLPIVALNPRSVLVMFCPPPPR